MKYALGKRPARPGAVSFKLSSYFNLTKLPTPSAEFGHYGLGAGLDWQVLANDRFGCCVWSGQAHAEMVWTHRSGHGLPAPFNDTAVLSDYAAATGFNPAIPSTDQGSDMEESASYWRKTGIVDANGVRHKIDSYLALRHGDVDELSKATYILGVTGIGLMLPDNAEELFNRGAPWTAAAASRQPIGGHYVPCVGRNSDGNFLIVTWGRLHAMSPDFYRMFSDEAVAYVSFSQLAQRPLSPEGFDRDGLRAALAALKNGG